MYNKGDKVKIRSMDWYNNHEDKNDYGVFYCDESPFTNDMSKLLDKEVTICGCYYPDGYTIEEDKCENIWTEDMFVSNSDEVIKIHNFTQSALLYSPSGKLIGEITDDLNFTDVRYQIYRRQLSGYYFIFNGIKIDIDKDGGIDNWVDGFFDGILWRLNRMFGI